MRIWLIFIDVDILSLIHMDLFSNFTITIRKYTDTLINDKINRVSAVIIDQLFNFIIRIHFPRNIEEGGRPPMLTLNLTDLGQIRALAKMPVSFLRSSIIMKITDRKYKILKTKRDFMDNMEAVINQTLLKIDDSVIIPRVFVVSICSSEGISLAINIIVRILIFKMNESKKTVGNFCHVNKIVVWIHGSFLVISVNQM
jgi:hypothetical protein